MASDTHEVYAITYGKHDPRPASDNFIGGDPHNGNDPLTYYVWAIVGDSGTIIVDTGFDEAVARRRNRVIQPLRDSLGAMSIDPDSIRDVIITHLHYDHSGNTALFPNARYHLQDCEMEYATGRCMCHAMQKAPFECDYVVDMVRNVYAGRVAFHDGADELAPGITLHHIGGHSKGLQCVRVRTKRGDVVLASDTAHLYAHIDQGRVFPITYNVADVLEGYQTLRKLATSRHHIVPGHDPRVLELYPPPRPELKGRVAKLDEAPKV